MREYLLLRLDGPLQAWGDVALDPRRPTLPCPSRSALAGLLGNALGWRYADADRLTALQDALDYAVREDRPPVELVDYQTADLDDPTKAPGWTARGLEGRGGAPPLGTQILRKHYLAGGCFRVALGLAAGAPVTLEELAEALRRPARPLFLGRKSCPPAAPLFDRRITAATPLAALEALPADREPPVRATHLRCWSEADASAPAARDVADRRDFRTNRFAGSRRVIETRVSVAELAEEPPWTR